MIEEDEIIKVGDEVYTSKDINGKYLDVGVVIRVCGENITAISKLGSIYRVNNHWKKTGRHFTQVQELLWEIGKNKEAIENDSTCD